MLYFNGSMQTHQQGFFYLMATEMKLLATRKVIKICAFLEVEFKDYINLVKKKMGG